jgi:hypothetical protein
MDCRTARLLLDFHRPRAGELPADEAADLERHLAGCPECDSAGRAERRLDEHIGRAVRDVPVPDGLREQLLARLKAERTAVFHRRLAWAARGGAVAAALLIGTFVWWHYAQTPPRLDPETLLAEDFEKYDSPTPEKVQDWFKARCNVAMIAPRKFDYGHLAEYEMTTLKGKPVPKLVFHRWDESNRTRARVFVLARERFDLSDLPKVGEEVETFGHKLTLDGPAESPDTRYLIIYEGAKLQALYTKEHNEEQFR